MRTANHPSKEEVRAYMRGREYAQQPPPPPDEIRRQLAWCRIRASPYTCLTITPAGVAAQGWYLAADMARLSTLMALVWLIRSGIAYLKNA
ncbi:MULTISPECIES: hypothetical protein [unclassified Janthinobacterium]|uniref:hypothetical protein n=1 Tax=unclassified Janthinobacterium TaxID=2610881 RepID=UPI0018CA4F60|nr:hypothetical protein [Janthinobacterium sp. CG_23.4]MDH6156731.1 hypothetical protein [Janthinobacterium sp. CG_23.4]